MLKKRKLVLKMWIAELLLLPVLVLLLTGCRTALPVASADQVIDIGNRLSFLKPGEVFADYGKKYVLKCDGVDICSPEYAWKCGYGGDQPLLLPRYVKWRGGSFVKPPCSGWIDIDPAAGRMRFAPASRPPKGSPAALEKAVILGNLTTWRLAVRGRIAYCAQDEETHAVQVIDFRDPAKPRYLQCPRMGGYPYDIVLGRKHAYLFTNSGRFFPVIDISDPERVKTVRYVPGAGDRSGVIDGNILLTWGKHGCCVYDISDERNPALLAVSKKLKKCRRMVINGDDVVGMFSENKSSTRVTLYHLNRKNGRLTPRGSVVLSGTATAPGGHDRSRIGLAIHGRTVLASTFKDLYVLKIKADGLKQVAVIPGYGTKIRYWGNGSGVLDMMVKGDRLYIAAGESLWPPKVKAPKNYVKWRMDARFPEKKFDTPYLKSRKFIGGVHIFDISDASRPKRLAVIDDAWIGYGCVNNVGISGDGKILVASCREAGLVFIDISNLKHPKFLSMISTNGEVEYARQIGRYVYAVGNGLYKIDPNRSAAEAVIDYVYGNFWMFGTHVTGNPLPLYNPAGVLFFCTQLFPNREAVEVNSKLKIVNFNASGLGRGQWIGNYITCVKEHPDRKPFGFEIWQRQGDYAFTKVRSIATEEPITHLLRQGHYLYAFQLRHSEKVAKYLFVYDVSRPDNPVKIAELSGPVDSGAMMSPEPYYYRGFLFLPGWLTMVKRTKAGGLGGFPGIRVIDVRDPSHPKPHALINYYPEDISVNGLICANSFYASGNLLYVADYWSGLQIFDIAKLASERRARHVVCIKDRKAPFNTITHCLSVNGYGSRLYTTHFGELKIWSIPVSGDLPLNGKLELEVRP